MDDGDAGKREMTIWMLGMNDRTEMLVRMQYKNLHDPYFPIRNANNIAMQYLSSKSLFS